MLIEHQPTASYDQVDADAAGTRVLLATDHSALDAAAEAIAIEVAARSGVPLVTVWPLMSNPEYEAVAPDVVAKVERAMALKIADFQEQALDAGVPTLVHVRRGEDRHSIIVAQARALRSELIVLRQNPQRSLLHSLLSGESVVDAVLLHASCHVLVVPPAAQLWRRRVLVAVTPGHMEAAVCSAAIDFATHWRLPLHLVVAIADDSQRRDALAFGNAMRERASHSGVPAEFDIRLGEPVQALRAALQSTHSDVLVLGVRKDDAKAKSAMLGIARMVLAGSKCPTLVVRV